MTEGAEQRPKQRPPRVRKAKKAPGKAAKRSKAAGKPPRAARATKAASADGGALSGRERQLAAIQPHKWKPGQSGNPAGRAKGSINITERLIAALKDRHPTEATKTWADVLVQNLLLEILKDPAKNWRLLARILDVDEGAVERKVAVRGEAGLLDLVRLAESRTGLETDAEDEE